MSFSNAVVALVLVSGCASKRYRDSQFHLSKSTVCACVSGETVCAKTYQRRNIDLIIPNSRLAFKVSNHLAITLHTR